MNILYYVGSGSHYQNIELMYSLRALEKHCKDVEDVWIVGNRPHFLGNSVKYLWVEDSGEWWQNAYRKVMAAIKAGIGDEFLLMNDDFYMLKDFEATKYPYYHKGEIKDNATTPYKQVISNTGKILKGLDKPYFHYGVHCPIRINAAKYQQLEKFYTGDYYGIGVSARCLYCNLFCKGKQVQDCKANEIKDSVTGCLSSKDWISDKMFKELEKMFPEPSKWEK